MNTKILTVLLAVTITIITCAAYITVWTNNKETDNIEKNPLEDIVLEIKENTVTNTGLTLIMKNVSPNNYVYGEAFRVEKKVDDGWCQVPYIVETVVTPSIICTLTANSLQEREISWTWWHGELSSGNYRIIKEFAYSMSPGINSDYYPTSTEFTIALPAY
jgi:hypothetical protein